MAWRQAASNSELFVFTPCSRRHYTQGAVHAVHQIFSNTGGATFHADECSAACGADDRAAEDTAAGVAAAGTAAAGSGFEQRRHLACCMFEK